MLGPQCVALRNVPFFLQTGTDSRKMLAVVVRGGFSLAAQEVGALQFQASIP